MKSNEIIKFFGDCDACIHRNEPFCKGCKVMLSNASFGRLNFVPETGTYSFSQTIDFTTQIGAKNA